MHKFPIALIIGPVLWTLACGFYGHITIAIDNHWVKRNKKYLRILFLLSLILILAITFNVAISSK